MKNYIANSRGDWATSAAFVKYSFERSIHHGRMYTNGHGFFKGKDEDLAEALRCLGQGLHTLEDFGAHTNYVELALIEMGYRNVFPHVGTNTMINLHGKHVYPLVTGTFGMVDFYHSVLGEATDHFTQSEVNEMDNALGTAQTAAQSSNPLTTLVKLLAKVPGTRDLCAEAERLQASSQAQARSIEQGGGWGTRGIDDDYSSSRAPGDWNNNQYQQPGWGGPQGGYQQQPSYDQNNWNQPPQNQNWQQPPPQQDWQQQPQQHDQSQFPGAQHNWSGTPPQQQLSPQPQMGGDVQHTPAQPLQPPQPSSTHDPSLPANVDPAKLISQIYPILAFRDKVVRAISSIIEKIPGLEALVDRIVETLTVFILSLLAPFVRPVLNALSKSLQSGSEGVINSSGKHQYEVWTNPSSSDPTHSMLSKDHFSNILNDPAGHVAAEILKFIAPRVLYAWEHPDVPVQQVLADVDVIFHHPAIRNERIEVHRTMFAAVSTWIRSQDAQRIEGMLGSQSVRDGKNHKAGVNEHAAVQHHVPSQQQMNAAAGGAGAGGLLGYASSFIPGQHGGMGQHGGGAAQHGGQQHSNNPLGMVGDLVGNFTGQGHGGQQQHHMPQHHGVGGPHGGGHAVHQYGAGGNPLGDAFNLANKLPIPGVQNITGQFNKFSHFIPGASGGGHGGGGHGAFGLGQFANLAGGGRRGLDDENDGGSRGIGGEDVYNAAAMAPGEGERSPSPMPLAPPEGYEMYRAEGVGYGPTPDAGGYDQHGQQGYAGGGQSGDYYGQQGGSIAGGQSGSYYR
jgi:Heterokaryon incompatibility protein Het-C